MATTAERIAVVETQVSNLDEKIDDLQVEVKASHADIKNQLKTMYDASCTQHAELATKIKDLEGFKSKWTYLILGGIAVLGWVSGHIDAIAAFLK
jgi:predicted  nucleic acid-binding Zn-ribbon protein